MAPTGPQETHGFQSCHISPATNSVFNGGTLKFHFPCSVRRSFLFTDASFTAGVLTGATIGLPVLGAPRERIVISICYKALQSFGYCRSNFSQFCPKKFIFTDTNVHGWGLTWTTYGLPGLGAPTKRIVLSICGSAKQSFWHCSTFSLSSKDITSYCPRTTRRSWLMSTKRGGHKVVAYDADGSGDIISFGRTKSASKRPI